MPAARRAEGAFSQTSVPLPSDDWIILDVGGKIFGTSRCTLASHGGMLADLADPQGPWAQLPGPKRLDRDPKAFRYVLEYLRNDKLPKGLGATMLDALAQEAQFFVLDDLFNEVKFIYPWQEKKREAKGTPAFLACYADYANRVFHYRGEREGEAKWRKLHDLLDASIQDEKQEFQCIMMFEERARATTDPTDRAIELMHKAMAYRPQRIVATQDLPVWRKIRGTFGRIENWDSQLFFWKLRLAELFDGFDEAKTMEYALMAYSLCPDRPEPLRFLADAYGRQQDTKTHLFLRREILRLAGDNAKDCYQLGRALVSDRIDLVEGRNKLAVSLDLPGLTAREQQQARQLLAQSARGLMAQSDGASKGRWLGNKDSNLD